MCSRLSCCTLVVEATRRSPRGGVQAAGEIHCRQRAAVPRRGKAASVVTALAALGAQQCKFQFTDDKKTKSSRKLNLRC
jgi:hypothetical protein